MDFNEEVVDLIRLNYYKGFNREQTFQSVSKEMDFKELPFDELVKRFQEFDQNKWEVDSEWKHDGEDFTYDELVLAIQCQFEFLRTGIFDFCVNELEEKAWSYDMKMLDSRYILAAGVIGKYRTGLILYDSFYGQKRFVEIEGAHFNFGKYSPIKLHILKPNRLLMFDGQSLSETDLTLVELDLEKMKGEFLYCNQFGSSIRVFSDSTDPEKFVVISPFCGEVDEPQIHCVKTDENSDSYDALMQKSSEKETTLLKFSGTFAHRYITNRLQCLKHEYIDGKEMLSFYEYDLSASKLKEEVDSVKLFEVSVEDEEIKDWYDGEFCWQGNQCFVDFRTYRLEKSCTRFYVFDIESQKLTSLNIGCMGSCFAINVDTDGFLLAQMLHYDSNISHYSVHRFALKEPDTLRNLCLFTIHHNPTLFKHPFYDKLISQLPLQLQPLAICPNKTEADKLMNVTKVEKRRQSDYLCFYEWKQKRLEVKKKEELNML